MKKIVILLVLIFGFSVMPRVSSATEPITPGRLAIIGGIIAGIEVIHGVYKLFTMKREKKIDFFSETENTNIIVDEGKEALRKYEALRLLLGRSRLYAVMEGRTEQTNELNLLMQEIIKQEPRRVSKGIFTDVDVDTVTTKTQKKAVFSHYPDKGTSVTNVSSKKVYAISPMESSHEFHYSITNRFTGEVSTKSSINYYEVGKAYFVVEKKDKAKEYFFKTINLSIDRVNKAKAILFLEQKYNMTIDIIIKEAREQRRREK